MEDDENNKAALGLNLVPQEVLKTERFELRPDEMSVFAVPNDRHIINAVDHIKAYEKAGLSPLRRRGVHRAASIESLITWLDAHTTDYSPVFATGPEIGVAWREPKFAFIGIGNYCDEPSDIGPTVAGWHDFRGEYHFPVSVQWKAWAEKHDVWQAQEAFSNFLDDHIHELTWPKEGEVLSEAVTRFLEATALENRSPRAATASEIYRLARELEANVDTKFTSKLNVQTGERTFIQSTENKGPGGQPLSVPNMFYIRFAPFVGGPEKLIGVRLRYKIEGGDLKFKTLLFAPDMIVREVFDAGVEELVAAGRTVYLGTPDYQP